MEKDKNMEQYQKNMMSFSDFDKTKDKINPEDIMLMIPNIAKGTIVKKEYTPTNSDEFNIWLNTLSEQRFNRFMKHMKSIGESKSV